MKPRRKPAMTWGDLKTIIGEMSEERLQHPVWWYRGENESGGRVTTVDVFVEDHVDPGADYLIPRSEYERDMRNEDPEVTQEELDSEKTVAPKGQTFLILDEPPPSVAAPYPYKDPQGEEWGEWGDLTINGLFCPVCGGSQRFSPSGPVCQAGHGGVEGVAKEG